VGNANLEWKDGCELAVRIDGKYFVDGTSSIPMAMLMPMILYCYQKASVIGEIKTIVFWFHNSNYYQKKENSFASSK
jgi:hypothetical protein